MAIRAKNKSRQTGKQTFSFEYAGYSADNDHVAYSNNEELLGNVQWDTPRFYSRRLRKFIRVKENLSVSHTKYNILQFWSTVFTGGGYFIPTSFPHNSLYGPLAVLENSLLEEIDSRQYAIVNELEKKFRPLDEGFNAFNFFYELREIASLLDPAKAVLKRFGEKPKGKTAKRVAAQARDGVDDIASTYVNANFGYVPTISDGFEIFKRLGSMETAFDDLKKSLEPRRKSTKDSFPFVRTFTLRGENSAGRVNYKIVFRGKVSMHAGGRCTYKMDMLESLGPLLANVQRGGIAKLNLATIWNAVPFSWAVDWLVPIGDALDSMSGDPLGITRSLSGSYSYKITGTWFVRKEDIQIDHPYATTPFPGHPIEDSFGDVSIYRRFPLPNSLEDYRHPPFKLGKLNLRKLLIGSSIAWGFK